MTCSDTLDKGWVYQTARKCLILLGFLAPSLKRFTETNLKRKGENNMTDMTVNVWRCPCCGYSVFALDEMEYGDIMCDACEVLMESAGRQDIAIAD